MKRPGTFGIGVMAMAVILFSLSMSLRCTAEPADDADFAALQVDARKSFKEVVTPFVDTYCTRCHGQNRQKRGINFGPALKNPGETASSKCWKQAVAIVKSYDIPPDEADTQLTDEERHTSLDLRTKIK